MAAMPGSTVVTLHPPHANINLNISLKFAYCASWNNPNYIFWTYYIIKDGSFGTITLPHQNNYVQRYFCYNISKLALVTWLIPTSQKPIKLLVTSNIKTKLTYLKLWFMPIFANTLRLQIIQPFSQYKLQSIQYGIQQTCSSNVQQLRMNQTQISRK